MRSPWFASPLLICGALTACGNSGTNKLADAPAGSADASGTVDAAPAPVTVIVTSGGAPVAGVVVYFLAADSTVVSNARTDATGHASAVMAAGGTVTVIEPAPSAGLAPVDHLDTWEDVQPGDVLTLTLGGVAADTTTFTITVPTDPAVGVFSYTLHTSCGDADITPPLTARPLIAPGTNPAVSVSLTNCHGVADMLVATQDVQGHLVSWLPAFGTAVASGTPVTLTGAYTPAESTAITYSGLPATVATVTPFEAVFATHGVVLPSTATAPIAVAAGGATATLDTARPTGATALVASLFTSTAAVFSDEEVFQWGPPGATYSYAADPLKPFASAPTVDVARQQVTWTLGATGKDADAVFTVLDVSRTTGTAHTWFWTIVAAGSHEGAVPIPTLPTDVFDYAIAAGDTATVQSLTAGVAPGGYTAIRSNISGFDPAAYVAGSASGLMQYVYSPSAAHSALRRP